MGVERIVGSCGKKGGCDRTVCNVLDALILWFILKKGKLVFRNCPGYSGKAVSIQIPTLILYMWTCHDLEGRELSDG